MKKASVLVALSCAVCFFSSPAKTQTCPDAETLRYEAALQVLTFFQQETEAVEALLTAANNSRNTAEQALAQCYNELESAKTLKYARLNNAGKLAKHVEHLQAQKDAGKRELDRAQQLLNAAKSPHVSSQQQAAGARQKATEALLIAQERSRAAALAWAEANAAQQQSTQWVQGKTNIKGSLTVSVPHGIKTAGSYVAQPYATGKPFAPATPYAHGKPFAPGKPFVPAQQVAPVQVKGSVDASKLTEIAKAAEYAAAVAEAEAKRLNEIASAAERSVQADWNNMSPSYHKFTHSQRSYQAICEAYAQHKAKYDVAILGVNAAETLILQKKEAIIKAKANLAAELEKIPALEAQLAAAQAVLMYAQALVDQLALSTTTMAPTTVAPTTASAASAISQSQNSRIMQLMRRLSNQGLGGSNRNSMAQIQTTLRRLAAERRAGRRGGTSNR